MLREDAGSVAEEGAFWCAPFPATEAGARTAVQALTSCLADCGVDPQRRGELEIAAAEAINNVVEHAYGGRGLGQFWITLRQSGTGLCLVLRDRGRPLPHGRLPAGDPVDLDVSKEALPEGGFGWFLIRTLAESVDYRQCAGENRLTLRFDRVFP